jgi:OOP family OmpA-OmpF porin
MRSPVPETSFKHLVLLSLSLLLFGSAARAENPPPLPAGDKPGSADLPFVRRFAGSIILSYERKSLDEVSWPLSRLEWVPGQKDTHNNDLAAPKKTKDATGERTTFVYVAPPERSSMEIIGSYRDQITAQKGKVLFECKGEGCGAKSTGNSLGGGGRMSLAMYLRSGDDVKEVPGSIPWCAGSVGLTDVRYLLAEIPAQGATMSVMTASPSAPGGACSALAGHTIALVDIIRAPRAAVNQ